MGNYFSSNKVNASHHLINTDNKITILVDTASIDIPVSQSDKTNIVGGEADADVNEPENPDVVEPEPVDDVVESNVSNDDVVESNVSNDDVVESNVSNDDVVESVVSSDESVDYNVSSGDSAKSEPVDVMKSEESSDDVEQQGGDSESSLENTTRVNKPKNRRRNKRTKN
jgi:hypothetical protein